MKVRGERVIEMLRGLAEGESVLVGADEWTALGDFDFEKTAEYGVGEAEFVHADDLQGEFENAAVYDVRR